MSGLLIPLGATVAAAVLTYLFCVRPMRGGRGCMPGNSRCTPETKGDIDAQLAAARAELDQLRTGTSPAITPADGSRR